MLLAQQLVMMGGQVQWCHQCLKFLLMGLNLHSGQMVAEQGVLAIAGWPASARTDGCGQTVLPLMADRQ